MKADARIQQASCPTENPCVKPRRRIYAHSRVLPRETMPRLDAYVPALGNNQRRHGACDDQERSAECPKTETGLTLCSGEGTRHERQ